MSSKKIARIRNILLGSGNPIRVQTMLNTDPEDYNASKKQLEEVISRGAEIVRITVPTKKSVSVFSKLRKDFDIPLVADIHFNHEMALEAMDAGADKIRINPGNIGDNWKVETIINKAKKYGIAIRIGVNSGSMPKKILEKYGHPTPEAMLETMTEYTNFFSKHGFDNIVLSAKSSSVEQTIKINELLFKNLPYPLHIGVTEAGPMIPGLIKSSFALSEILKKGIGDTIRISLTSSPINEVDAGFYLLKLLGLRNNGIEIISCPTCGRTKVNLESIVNEVYKKLPLFKYNMKLALMGCVVNGPGEAKEADLGLAFGPNEALYFEKGVSIEKIPANNAIKYIISKIKIIGESHGN